MVGCIILTLVITGCIGQAETRSTTLAIPTVSIPEHANSTPSLNETFWIHINPVGNKSAGDTFFINGTTNLNVSEYVLVQVYPADFKPGQKLQCGEFGLKNEKAKTLQIFAVPFSKVHKFSWGVNTSDSHDGTPLSPQEYTVTVDSVLFPAQDRVNFTLMPSPLSASVNFSTRTCG